MIIQNILAWLRIATIKTHTCTHIFFVCLFIVASILPSLPYASDIRDHTIDTLAEGHPDPVILDDVIVRANRLPLTVMKIPAAATVLEVGTAEKSTYRSVGDLAGGFAGFRAYPIGNLWGRTQVDVRGFYGGGQAEYVMVTYDGIPMNSIASGQTPWTILNIDDVDRLESIPGPVSAQYGDFGFGGLLAMYSPSSAEKRTISLSMSGGSNDAWGFHTRFSARSPLLAGTIAVSKKRNEGWRRHSRFESENALVGIHKGLGRKSHLSALIAFGHSDEQFPGALTDDDLHQDRTGTPSSFGMEYPDFARIDDLRAGLSADIELGRNTELRSLTYLSLTKTTEAITITLPVRHEPRLFSAGGEVSLGIQKRLLDRPLHIVVGFRSEYGELDSDYFVFDSAVSSSHVIRSGEAFRRVLAGYIHGLYYPHDNLFVSTGIRVDNIWSEYGSMDTIVSHREYSLSPKFALGVDLKHGFTAYVSIAGAFKAPTLVHLYDSPPIYFELEPGAGEYFNISNSNLKAQTGTCYEVGLKFLDGNRTSGRLSAYNYDISGEIDFDLSTNSYRNIGTSRHRGIEFEGKQQLFSHFRGGATLAYTSSTIRGGEFDGHQINGVPNIEYSAHITYDASTWGFMTVNATGQGVQYLEQANKRKLGEYHLLGVSAGVSLWGIRFTASVHNLFDREYNYDGYVGLQNESRFYPAAGRSVFVTVSTQL